MSIKTMGRVIDHSKHKGGNLLTLMMISNYVNSHFIAWPGVSTKLKKDTRMTPEGVSNCIDHLAVSGELLVFPRNGKSHHFIVMTGMKFGETRIAIDELSGVRKQTTKELNNLRKDFRGEAQERIAKRKKARTKRIESTSSPRLRLPPNPASDEPLLTIKNHQIPKGIDATASLSSPKITITPLKDSTTSKDVKTITNEVWEKLTKKQQHGFLLEAYLLAFSNLDYRALKEGGKKIDATIIGKATRYAPFWRDTIQAQPAELIEFYRWFRQHNPNTTLPDTFETIEERQWPNYKAAKLANGNGSRKSITTKEADITPRVQLTQAQVEEREQMVRDMRAGKNVRPT